MWVISLTLVVVIITLWFAWRKKKLSLFKRLNIPGPEPSIFFGNYWDLYSKGQHNCINKWIKEYGKIFGYYYGLRPALIVADLDLIRIIQQKEFHKFTNRPILFEFGASTKDFNKYAMTTAEGKKWKELRSIITPTFTTSKLKMMYPIMQEATNELVDAVKKKSAAEKPFNICDLYQNLTMDVIARTSLGVHSKAQTEGNEPFVKVMRALFAVRTPILTMLAFSFPEFMSIFSPLRLIVSSLYNEGRNPRTELQDRTAAAVKLRRSDPNTRRRDLLQLMMDAQRTEENVNDSILTAGENDNYIPNGATQPNPSKNVMKLSDKEILQNAALFLLAGFETTSTGLAFITYCLVKNQDVQEKVREEIKKALLDNKELSYEVVHKLQYLDKVIHESLRLHPPVTYFVNRRTEEDIVIENVILPKGVAIQVPVYHIHHDPAIWEDPEKFDPERFSPEEKANRHPLAFQVFGAGPRNCVGMRFALMEIKMALANLISKYKFLPYPLNTDVKLEIHSSLAIDRPDKGIIIQAVKV